jgi:hypothetical protein
VTSNHLLALLRGERLDGSNPEDVKRQAADEIERLRDLLRRSWFKGAHMEPGLQDEVLAYFGEAMQRNADSAGEAK